MKIVRVGPNPAYKLPALKPNATQEEKDAWNTLKASWAAVKDSRTLSLPYVTAMDNIRNSGGMYAIIPEAAPAATATAIQMPEEMSNDALKLTALQLGVDLSKKNLKRSELVAAVRKAMDAVQFAAEDEDDAEA